MTGAITTNSTFDGVDIATRDAILTSTTTTADAALPKAGGTMAGNIAMGGNDISGGGTITGTFSGNITGNADTATTSATVTGAAQTAITSVGTLTALDVDNININGDTITASGDMALVATGNDVTVDTDNFVIESASLGRPVMTLLNTNDGNKPSFTYYKHIRANPATGDGIHAMFFQANNDNDELITCAKITTGVEDATDGAEEGNYRIAIKNTSDVGPQLSFTLTGNGAHTDATIGYGTSSVTTLTGTLAMGSTQAMDNVGLLVVPGQTNITSLGTLTALQVDNININGNTITSSTAADLVINVADGQSVVVEGLDIDDGVVTGASSITSTAFVGALTGDVTGNASGTAATVTGAAQTAITSVGTLTELQVDNININGDTIKADADLSITALGGDIEVNTNTFLIESTASQFPLVTIKNLVNNQKSGTLIMEKDRGAAGVAGDGVGSIQFNSKDAGNNAQAYATIVASIADPTEGDEAGKLTLGVATDGGFPLVGLTLEGEHDSQEIDVLIGLGSTSTTTIAGTLTMGSTPAMDNVGLLVVPGQTNITSLGTLTALDVDNININGNTIKSTAGTDLTITALAGQQVMIEGVSFDSNLITACNITFDTNKGVTNGHWIHNENGSGTWTGDVSSAIPSGEESNPNGKLMYLKSDGRWYYADHASVAHAQAMLAMSVFNGLWLYRGNFSHANFQGYTPGLPVYMDNLGLTSQTATTTSGEFVRIIGYGISSAEEYGTIWFNPDSTFIEIA